MLHEGDIIKLPSSGLAKVIFVNESRARLRSLAARSIEFTPRFPDNVVSFSVPGKEWDVSPNSEVVVVKAVKDF